MSRKKKHPLAIVFTISVVLHVLALAAVSGIIIWHYTEPEEPVLEVVNKPIEPKKPEVKLDPSKNEAPPPKIAVPPIDLSVTNVNIPDLALKGGRGSIGSGLGGTGSLGVMMAPTTVEIPLTEFGYLDYVAGTLKGRLFDVKKSKRGNTLIKVENKRLEMGLTKTLGGMKVADMDYEDYERKFKASKKELYASFWMVPHGPASKAPDSFNAPEIEPKAIVAYYKGDFIPWETGTFRFAGVADDILIAKVRGRIVFDGSYQRGNYTSKRNESEPKAGKGYWKMSGKKIRYGDWMRWKEGEPVPLEIMLGEVPGGNFACYLLYQKEDEERLRVFSTKPLTDEEKSRIRRMHKDASQWLD